MPTKNTPNPESIPYGYCHCGCGEKTQPAKQTERARGYVKGEPVRFLPYHYSRVVPRSEVRFDASLNCYRVALSRGLEALVSSQDIERVSQHKWHAVHDPSTGNFYAARNVASGKGQKAVRMHREIADADDGDHVDHINRDTLDNRQHNLRLCSHKENSRNRKPRRDSKSEFKGVYQKESGRWSASITTDGKTIWLGTFASAQDAARAYDRAAITEHGEFALTNKALGLLEDE